MPFPGQEARVVHVHSRDVLEPGQDGEIEVRGPHVCAGYWQRPDATAGSFASDGWFATGDLGQFSADGYLTINGRAKELIISGGYNIYPREVEEVIEALAGVREVAVLGLPDPEFGENVVAVVCASDAHLDSDTVIAHCRANLAGYKKPRRVAFVDALPRNGMGKVMKHVLREQLITNG
jgi:malonyl-CoA/methylmalonyl-CoA synthetase